MCDSPYAVNKLINSQQVSIKRDNEADANNFGKEVYLKIFDPQEISAGQSRYQIVRQPRFKTLEALHGDVMLSFISSLPCMSIPQALVSRHRNLQVKRRKV